MQDKGEQLRVLISGTFAADPIVEPLSFWARELDLSLSVELTPFGQVFQELLDPRSATSTNENGFDVLLVRMEDCGALDDLEPHVREVNAAVKAAAARASASFILCVCPPSAAALATPAFAVRQAHLEKVLTDGLRDSSNIFIVQAAELVARHPVSGYDDAHADAIAHVPYSDLFFTTMATSIMRQIHRIARKPRKVVVLDCDNTLWQGICGEDGADGIVLSPPYQALQRFAVARHDAGMLLCLCSKNNPDDVWAVFERRPEMPLQLSHVISSRINWDSKSNNLRSLAQELNLGLDSFIFVDDDPLVCAEVEAACPEVTTLLLPSDVSTFPRFLDSAWVFDCLPATAEDRDRTTAYRRERERDQVRSESPSLGDFLQRLQLEVSISPLETRHIARVAQLTHRTNQFNASTIRRNEAEIGALSSRGLECLVVDVKDRFGDYGLVGVMIFGLAGKALQVDSLLLSCRALGRGVEHRMLAWLGEAARDRGLERVDVQFVRSAKNAPVHGFLEAVGALVPQGEDGTYQLPTAHALAVEYRLENPPLAADSEPAAPDGPPGAPITSPLSRTPWSRIANEYYDSSAVVAAIAGARAAKQKRCVLIAETPYVAARSPVEEGLVNIWSSILAVDQIGIDDDFFELDGDSLKLIRMISRVHETYGIELPLSVVFQLPTVAAIGASIVETQGRMAALLEQLDDYSEEEAIALASVEAVSPDPRPRAHAGPLTSHITSLVVCTYERPDALIRALNGYARNTKRYGRSVNVVVMDQSRTAQMRATSRDRLREFAQQYEMPVAYAGREEKERFAKRLQEVTSVSSDTVTFALFAELPGEPMTWATRLGAQRNAALLHTVGEKLLSVDDDTVCDSFVGPEAADRPKLAMHCDPADSWFFGNDAEARALANPVDIDVLAEHERLLGTSPRAADFREVSTPFPWPNASDTPLRDRIEGQRAKVMVTYNGLLGDCGLSSPFGYWGAPLGSLVLEGPSHQRMVRSKEAYATALGTRIILRVAASPSVSDTCAITAFFGLDNRDLVPPFMPMQRGEDLLFARMLWRCIEHSCFGHLPTALRHTPIEARRFSTAEVTRSATGYDLAKLMVDCILSCPLRSGEGSPGDRLRVLGEHLIDLGKLPMIEFDRRLRAQAARTMGEFTEWMVAHVEARGGLPDYWASDVRKYVAAVRVAIAGPDYCVPLDLVGARTFAEARLTGQRVVLEFGRLCQAWPALVLGARALRVGGGSLARELQ